MIIHSYSEIQKGTFYAS